MILLTLITAALALPCADPFTADEFTELVRAAEEALDNDDVMAHGQTWRRMKESMPCLVDPLPKDAWARYLIGFAIIRHATGEKWRSPLMTALRIDPDIDREYGHDDIRLFPAPPLGELRGLELAKGEAFLLDGLVIPIAPPFLEGPHVLQMAGDPYKTRLIIDEDFPADWLEPDGSDTSLRPAPQADPPREPPRKDPTEKPARERSNGKGLLVSGVALAVVGSGAAVASYALATKDDVNYETPAPFKLLVVGNVAGWSAAGVGVGLVSVHIIKSTRVEVGPSHLAIHGRW